MLRTNTDLDPLAAILRYKKLWTVETTFRTAKHLLATRPIFHKLDATIRGFSIPQKLARQPTALSYFASVDSVPIDTQTARMADRLFASLH